MKIADIRVRRDRLVLAALSLLLAYLQSDKAPGKDEQGGGPLAVGLVMENPDFDNNIHPPQMTVTHVRLNPVTGNTVEVLVQEYGDWRDLGDLGTDEIIMVAEQVVPRDFES